MWELDHKEGWKWSESESRSVVSDSMWPHGLSSPWNSPGQNTGVGSLSLLQQIFPTQRLNPGLPHCRRTLYQLSHKGSPRILEWVTYPFSRGSSRPRNQTQVSRIAGGFFTRWAIRAPQNWCFWIVMLKKTSASPLDCKEIQPVNHRGNQSWVFIGGIDAKSEAPILWPFDVKNTHWKRPWSQERLKARGEGNDREWDVWMASLTQ